MAITHTRFCSTSTGDIRREFIFISRFSVHDARNNNRVEKESEATCQRDTKAGRVPCLSEQVDWIDSYLIDVRGSQRYSVYSRRRNYSW
jgi:hypothetical protein